MQVLIIVLYLSKLFKIVLVRKLGVLKVGKYPHTPLILPTSHRFTVKITCLVIVLYIALGLIVDISLRMF